MKKILTICGLVLIGISGCNKEPEKVSETEQINNYVQENGLNPIVTASGLQYEITIAGAGPNAKTGDTVRVNYVGFLLNGNVFDTSIEAVAKANGIFNSARKYVPFEFILEVDPVILGWQEGIALLNEGAEATLLIPSVLAYGSNGAGQLIGPNTPIAFTVELVEIKD
jgi:FKBP-type peptidyl-prolyl cis-trans isomerase FkpA